MSFFTSSKSRPSVEFFFLLLLCFLTYQPQSVGATRNVALIFGYVPNQTAAIIAAAFYFCFGGILVTFHIVRLKNWWALALPIGTLGSCLGFIARYILAEPAHQTSKTIMIVEEVLTLCSPAAFLAFDYIVYGRLLLNCIGARHSFIRPQWVSTFFITSDISTFVIQAIGAAFVVQPEHHNLGEKVVEAGVILQTISFGIFSAMLLMTYINIKREGLSSGTEIWWRAYQAVAFSSVFIVVSLLRALLRDFPSPSRICLIQYAQIRSIYRMISSIQGSASPVATAEIYLYLLDVLPLMISIGVYIPFWPGDYITGEDSIVRVTTAEQHKLSTFGGASRELLVGNEV
ncbi:RTA1 like protein-domain-containing protein [Lentinula aciculospora]|uniref:RTA1 like protein-domain-containing protein n=1 Tax=Lentinula aciculospora TaxID=153920 RepID=A0A9W9ABT1_9AGAR|nr:RTA1 like protein-domain-containing protein [Lentinula aciculospora]